MFRLQTSSEHSERQLCGRCHSKLLPQDPDADGDTALNILFSKSTREAGPKKKKVYDRAKLTAVTADAVDTDLL